MCKGEVHYLPHQSIIRVDKSTTKVRIIFEAHSGEIQPSLKECVHNGPQTKILIFNILLHFHTFKIALITDIGNIGKAFLQTAINEKNRDFLQFLWFDNVFCEQPKIVRDQLACIILL